MKRLLVIAVLVLVGCTPAAPALPSLAVAATSTPTPMPTPTPTATPTATPIPPPTKEELAAAYLKAATTYNTAADKAWKTFRKSPRTLTYVKRLDAAYAKAELAFIRAVQAIPWTADFKPIAGRLITCSNQEYVYDKSASKATTTSDVIRYENKATAQSEKCAGIANELRLALGLPPVPIT